MGVLVGGLTGILFGVGGFILSGIPGTHAMGAVVFLLVPIAAGLAITLVSHDLGRVSAAALLATIGSLAILIAMHMETLLCALLAFPLLLLGLMIGIALGILFHKLTRKPEGSNLTFT